MTLATTWRFVNVAWWLFSLYGAIWIMARRPPYASVAHRILVLSVTQAIALILFTLGFILEPTLWILLNQGVLEIPEALDSLFTVSGFVSHVFEPALLPASVAVLTAAITARRSSRVLFCASSTVAVLLAYDLVIRLLGKPVQSPLVFSVFSDVLGGTLAGALVAFTWSVLIDTPHSPLSRRQASIGLITLRTILIAGTGSYLVFLRYLPESVVLDLRAWDTVSFEYVGTRLSYSRFLPTMATSFTVSSPTGWVTGTLPGEARLELYDEETLLGERPTQIFVTIAELVRDSGDPVATPIDLLVGARTIFSGQIEGGDIRINSDLFNMAVLLQERGEAEPSDALILGDRLRNQLVRITHDPRAIVLLALGGLAESVYSRLNSSKGWLPGKGPLTIFAGEDARMRKGGIRQAIVVIGSPPSIKWSIGHRDDPVQVRITLPNGKVVQAANQPFKAKTGLNGLHGIALLIGQPTDKASKTLVTDVGRYTVCPSCEIELKPRGGLLGNVTKFRVTGVDGRLQVGLKEYDLKTRGEVFLGAGEMGIEEIQAGTIRLKGRTAPVTLDGVVLSSTLWSTIPNEVKAVLIAAVLSLAGGFLLKLRVWPFVGIIFLVAFRIIG